jgi:hypothetical protein
MAYDKIVDSQILDNTFTQIANAIREKTGLTDTLEPSSMAYAITNIDNSDEYKDLYEAEKARADGLAETNAELQKSVGLAIDLIERDVTEVVIPEGVTKIGSYAFCNSILTSVTIPESVEIISDYAFLKCSKLTSIAFPQNLKSLGTHSFTDCTSLIEIVVPPLITKLGWANFNSCTALKSVTLQGRITYIPYETFMYCSSLQSINLPNSLTGIGSSAFNGCSALEFVTLEKGFNCAGLNLSASTLYSVETIVSWLEALADRTGQTAYTLTIGATNLAKLTDDQKAIATNKNWTLA